ncbi:helix-turn-helix transcriptional regulator [Mycolicibacterium sp. Y3]
MHDDDEEQSAAESVNQRFGNQMRERRMERGLSQRDLADLLRTVDLQLDPSAVTRIERGTREVKLVEALAISKLLGFELDRLTLTHADRNARRLVEMRAVLSERAERIRRATLDYLIARENFQMLADAVRGETAPTEIEEGAGLESRGTTADELALAIRDLARDPHEFCDAGQDSFDEYKSKTSEYPPR